MNKIRFIGLDIHANTIAVAEPDGEVRSIGMIPNREESVRRCMKKLGDPEQLRRHRVDNHAAVHHGPYAVFHFKRSTS